MTEQRRRAEQGRGTIKTVRNRKGDVIGYQAMLPRHLSTPPRDCKNPKLYQEPLGERQQTETDARTLLDAAITTLLKRGGAKPSLTFAHFVSEEIAARHHAALRKYGTEARAKKATLNYRSITRNWLDKTAFYDLPIKTIDAELELVPFFRRLNESAFSTKGKPLSPHTIRQIGSFTRAVFARGNVTPNPMLSVKLPAKSAPKVPFLDLASQRRFFTSTVPLVDRVMMGCGMGAGLRVGELLAIEVPDVHLDEDPHIIVRYGGSDHAPPKGKRIRRVELVEPGLGFWRLWMAAFYRGSARVFGGPQDGYDKSWPEAFPAWAELAGQRHMSSHIMRHTYAVAMLSGTWGYEPKGLDFVQQQLGHVQRATTEYYYGAYEHGTWQREARIMRGAAPAVRRVVTAAELLASDSSSDSSAKGEPLETSENSEIAGQFIGRCKSKGRRGGEARSRGLTVATPQAVLSSITAALEAYRDRRETAHGQILSALIAAHELVSAIIESDVDETGQAVSS